MSKSTWILIWTSIITVVLLVWATYFYVYNIKEVPESITMFTKVNASSIDAQALEDVNR